VFFIKRYLCTVYNRCEDLIHPNATTCTYRLRSPPSWLWPKCNRLMNLGCSYGAVTLLRWCEWWYVWAWSTRRGLKPKFYRLPRPRSLWGSSPARENSYGRTGNQSRDLRASSQKFWPPSHEAGREDLMYKHVNFKFIMFGTSPPPHPPPPPKKKKKTRCHRSRIRSVWGSQYWN
jgi:hypothetical protein